jgi:hypothetical protein
MKNKKKEIRVVPRDPFAMDLIQKGEKTHQDKKKEKSKKSCREKIQEEE